LANFGMEAMSAFAADSNRKKVVVPRMGANVGIGAPAAPELTGSTSFCRDCLTDLDIAAGRCGTCGSPRFVRHSMLPALALAHIDCDAFYATVEKRDNPELADKPVIIGGGKRGVVSAACYIARTFGVRSAMPMFKALALCPSAVVVRPDMAKYVRVGREVRHAMQALTPLVEPLSIDEAFLDLSGTQRVHGMIPAKVLARFAREVERNIGITVSVGLSCNKFLAKIASELDKPRGFAALDQAEACAMLADKPVGFIFGVGPATQERLIQRGFRTIADLQRADETELMKQFSADGRRLWRLARGIDDRRVAPDRGAKTISSETTFEADIRDFATLEKTLWRLSEKVSLRLKNAGLSGSTITLKLKTADFRQRTRSQSIHGATQLAAKIFAICREMLAKEIDGTAFRLMGAGVSALRPGSQADDTDMLDRRSAHAERAMDNLRKKFGDAAVMRGIAYDGPEKAE
jgi:DNA polymerase IV